MANSDIRIEKYCSACGNGLIATAAICPKCGSPAGRTGLSGVGPASKSKTVAVLLAVFLGLWTYLYTYREDKIKFWIWLPIVVVAIFFEIITAVLMATSYSDTFNTLGVISSFVYFIAIFVSWLVALITTVKRTQDFFTNY
jgi:uncharacterized protein (DUF983 family)